MRASFRNRIVFVSPELAVPLDPNAPMPKQRLYFTITSDEPEQQWLVEATNQIPEYAAFFRSVYMRWAITINALHVARDRYASLGENVGLTIGHLEVVDSRQEVRPMEIWPSPKAAENYEESIPLMAAYGLLDLYGAIEEIIFDLYETYLNHHPLDILKGNEFAALRKLYRSRDNDAAATVTWNEAWASRLEIWRRKKLYDGLHRVFKSYFERAGLRRPSWFKLSDIDDWAKTVELIGEIRNLITHGENHVSQKLADLCTEQPQLGLRYIAGEVLEVKLHELMIVERFFADIINTLNECLLERAWGPLKQASA